MTASAISILMPVDRYHRGYLGEAVGSVLGQTSEAWRLVIVTEPQRELELRALLANELQDARIELIVNRGRKLSGALNTGMRAAQTKFVAILHGDDKWAPRAIEILSREIRSHPEVDFFHSSRMVIDERGAPLSPVYRSRTGVSLQDFGAGSPVKHLLCWRRSKALAVGGMDETLNSVGPDDFDFPWSMAEHGAVFRAIDECLYLYRDHRSSPRLTTHLPLSVHARELRRIMRKHGAGTVQTWIAVLGARRSFMRQCLYRSEADRRLKERLGLSPVPWRETYR